MPVRGEGKMLTEAERHRAAEEMLRAERERKAVPRLSKTFPNMEIEDAYRVQELWGEARIAKGARIAGHKIGLTSRAMQMASKMTSPTTAASMTTPSTTTALRFPLVASSSRVLKSNWLWL
jgi:2-keto-4-pentenoate hydratase